MPVKTYDFKHVRLVIGTRTLTGYGEDGGIEVEPNSDVAEFSVDADGGVTVSVSNDKSMIATITVRESGRGYRELGELLATQEALGGRIPGYSFAMFDEISGETVSDGAAVFIGRPTISKNKTVGDREFRLLLPTGADGLLAAPLNT